MGAWGEFAFDNDTANDWAYGLMTSDLSLVEYAFDELEEVGDDYLDQDVACNALAACEVIARLRGNPGYKNAFTEKVDEWVAAHKLKPSPVLVGSFGRDRPDSRRAFRTAGVVGRRRRV